MSSNPAYPPKQYPGQYGDEQRNQSNAQFGVAVNPSYAPPAGYSQPPGVYPPPAQGGYPPQGGYPAPPSYESATKPPPFVQVVSDFPPGDDGGVISFSDKSIRRGKTI